MFFRLPEGVTAVTVEGIEFHADENQLISAEGCSGSVFETLVTICKAVRVNDASAAVGFRDGEPVVPPTAPGIIFKSSYPPMAFKVRDGVGAVCVNEMEFVPDAAGRILVRSCSEETRRKLVEEAGCESIRLPNLLPDERAFKAALLVALDQAGVQKDGRTSVAHLRALAEETGIDIAAIEAATAVDFAVAA